MTSTDLTEVARSWRVSFLLDVLPGATADEGIEAFFGSFVKGLEDRFDAASVAPRPDGSLLVLVELTVPDASRACADAAARIAESAEAEGAEPVEWHDDQSPVPSRAKSLYVQAVRAELVPAA